MNKQEEIRTLLIEKTNGEEFQVDIPVTWKVTFGPAVPFTSKESGKTIPTALRIYESEKMQRAIFTDVISFRDLSIPMRIKKTHTQEKDGFMECEGIRKRTTFQATTSEWVNADEEVKREPALLQMPTDSEMFLSRK